MKIKVEAEKIIKAVKKLDGIQIVLEDPDDAREAIQLVLRKTDLFSKDVLDSLKDVKVSSFQEYKTSAVNYEMVFLLDFEFDAALPLDERVSVIKRMQDFFEKL